jgi:S-adenosylmethionine hydrolase
VELPPFGSEVVGGALSGTIVHVDRYGNAITSISAPALTDFLRARKPGRSRAAARTGRRAFPLREYYAEASPGRPLALLGSCGLLELSLRDGDAAARFGLRRGQTVTVR